MEGRLYWLVASNPSHAARAMLERKGIEHETVDLLPGLHPIQLRLAGFRGTTVPALKLDGRRVQTSLAISRELDRLCPEPPLFPADPERRRAVEEAERWGDAALQPIPRRLIRWAAVRQRRLRAWIAADARIPAPDLVATLNGPVARAMAAKSHGDDGGVRETLAALPRLLDRVDELLAEGTIGGPEPNAADYQLLSTVRALLALEVLRPAILGRPSAEHAMRLFPTYSGPIPVELPAAWLPS